jgi:hypothetical protein
MRQSTRIAAAALSAAVILWGCGSKQAATPATAAAATHRLPSAAQTLSRSMVSAVPASKPAAVPVQVRFALRARPAAAEPVDIGLVLLPTAAVDRISGKIVTDDGLQLVEGGEIAVADRPAEGVPIEHSVKLLPRRDGIFTFNAVLTVDSGARTSTETFSMPVIVAAGVPGGSPKAVSASPARSPARSQ